MKDTPTPRTDAAANESIVKVYETSLQLETELTAAREEITLLKTNLKIQTNHTENAVQDRADEHIELHNQIHKVTEQRDRLANALDNLVNANQKWNETMIGIIGRPPNWNESYLNEAKEALQSLDQPTEL